MDLGSFSALEGLLIGAVVTLAGAIAWGVQKLLKAFGKNTEAFTALNSTMTEMRNEHREHRQVDREIAGNLGSIRTILEMQARQKEG